MEQRIQIAVSAMQALLQKDFKNIGFSAFNSGHKTTAEYIADQSFLLADAMIKRSLEPEVKDEE